MKNIICPYHQDTRPSLRIYGEWAHCYACGAHVKTEVLDLPGNPANYVKPEPTDVEARIKYIQGLPTKTIRGLQLPYDHIGFYIVWPNKNYYKRRNITGDVRYIAPSGVKPPLFVYPGSARHLIVVEGELNAMSLHQAVYGEFKICSPGPASDFMRHIRYYQSYSRITLFTDHDAAGIVFGVQLKEHLLKAGKYVNLITRSVDFNQVLQDGGEEAVRVEFEKDMR